jgi:hypothetical protein
MATQVGKSMASCKPQSANQTLEAKNPAIAARNAEAPKMTRTLTINM